MTSVDSRVLRVAGMGLLALAAMFLWRDLQLAPSWSVVGLAVFGLVATVRGAKGDVPWLAPVGLFALTLLSSGMWLALKEPVQLIGVGACVVATAVLAARTRALWATPMNATLAEKGRVPALVTWAALALGALALSGGVYFHALTLQVDSEARRLVLTAGWALLGLALVVFALRTAQSAPRDAGFLVLAVAVLKVLLYDTTHLDGSLRVGALALVGVLLLAGSSLVRAPTTKVSA